MQAMVGKLSKTSCATVMCRSNALPLNSRRGADRSGGGEAPRNSNLLMGVSCGGSVR